MQAKIHRNRERALQLRKARLAKTPYSKKSKDESESKEIDTGAGFFLEVVNDSDTSRNNQIVEEPGGPIIGLLKCMKCQKNFGVSYLYNNFEYKICDNCRDTDGEHSLITRTEAKQKYLLKDCDLDMREPILKYISKKNPHNPRWGLMKLYLLCQIEERCYQIWGDEQGLQDELIKRAANQEQSRQKKFDKRIQALRKAFRSSTWTKNLSRHEHRFAEGQEIYDEKENVWVKSCIECDYRVSFEKM
ncbi:expressed hypothetical protein [Trichoplax adhaerens]|uniref:XPA C-terminal domain-containing protein n=1 Tax=Trichoplax adhaerens TaxID=10228 RepID=B3S7X4_TRIAD|nr:expressed hypothetical protein [Trichoplax adhaerens]EDV21010.1 expressed hypothetical protein [Trichoplax adhaerens]|eukprot:XP_002116340.1 expressed hypothetical protein [Trichoplax adhaerens]